MTLTCISCSVCYGNPAAADPCLRIETDNVHIVSYHMSSDGSKSLDLLGLKGISDSIHTVTKGGVDGCSAILSRICNPAAEEIGLLLRDKVKDWRANNAKSILLKAEKHLAKKSDLDKCHAHPRLLVGAIENGSWSDNDVVQEMWAGLLASSCNPGKPDDGNLIFIELLARLTEIEIVILKYSVESAKKYVSKAGWPVADVFQLSIEQLVTITGIQDFHRIDRELDHLRSLGLICGADTNYALGGGFNMDSKLADICPTPLALHLYVRSHGFIGSPIEYFDLPVQNQEGKPKS